MPDGRMRSVDATHFGITPRRDIQRSRFSYRFQHKTTFQAGKLIPFHWEEVLPGDSFTIKMDAFARLATALVPVMDNLTFETAFFFVPNRLLWTNWKRFMGEKDNPTDTTEFVTPIINIGSANCGPATIYDYLGIHWASNAASATVPFLAFPLRAYNQIWNQFFRHQHLQVPAVENKGDGPDNVLDYGLQEVGKKHDYFTTALPWPELPLKTGLTTTLDGTLNSRPGGTYSWPVGQQSGAPVTGIGVVIGTTSNAGQTILEAGGRQVAYGSVINSTALRGDVHNISGTVYPNIRVMVNDIRTSVMIQSYMEATARGGARYTEIIRQIFGVVSPDFRLQRPEYLGGGRSMVSINPITQTSATKAAGDTAGGSTKFGEQAGVGSLSVYDHSFSQSFTEHGIILCLGWVRSDLSYQQGTNRAWFRRTLFDYYNPYMANLGEQAILRREIYQTGVAAEDQAVFGYQERWSEMKSKPSIISGYFNSTLTAPLDMWHFGEKFGSAPQLNDTFIRERPPIDRVLQSTIYQGQQFVCDTLFTVHATRPMPIYSIPGLGGRI